MKTLPTAAQASRRALLRGLAVVAATPMAPALANALSGPAPAGADPIYALIDKHTAACDAARAICDVWSELSPDDDDPNYVAVCERFKEGTNSEREILVALLTCRPTTLGGVVAVLEHVGQRDWVYGEDSEETVLIDAHEREIEEAKMFLKHLASAASDVVRTRGQA